MKDKRAQSGAFLAMFDYDASLTALGAQKVDVVPGKKKEDIPDRGQCGGKRNGRLA